MRFVNALPARKVRESGTGRTMVGNSHGRALSKTTYSDRKFDILIKVCASHFGQNTPEEHALTIIQTATMDRLLYEGLYEPRRLL